MEIFKQISSLHKIRGIKDLNVPNLNSTALLQGESFYYQIVMYGDTMFDVTAEILSPLKDYITLFKAENVVMDYPLFPNFDKTNYITTEPGSMPDLLTPIADGYHTKCYGQFETIWVKLDLPKDVTPGNYDININFTGDYIGLPEPKEAKFTALLKVEILDAVIPEQKTTMSQWFHTDCIAMVHNVPVYSEEHWELIGKYMTIATELGMNMILTPIITPPLDTGVGLERPNVQLVRMEKKGDNYEFDFSLLVRWIHLAKSKGFKFFEIAHLFSQWGLKYAPNIYIWEDGELKHMFGWHVDARDPEYARFLGQFVPQVVQLLKDEGVADSCYFHVSDEPHADHIEAYTYAKNIVKPLIGDIKTCDALSNKEFYLQGAVQVPIPGIYKANDFADLDIPEKWTYYCCSHGDKVSNRFLSMPLSRTRIIGLQMYKFGFTGFLQWGFNFYFSQFSRALINPYTTSSACGAFPSGDAYTVYPGIDGPLASMRGYVFKNALQDIEMCRLLESYIGKEKVVEIIDSVAGMDITFNDYPWEWDYVPKVMNVIKDKIKEYKL